MENIKKIFINKKRNILKDQVLLDTAVLVPLITYKKEPALLFEVRSHELKVQPGEICFPGGHMENNEQPRETALRETSEELRIDPNNIELLGPLDILMTPFQLIIYPFVGYISPNIKLHPDPREVEKVFAVPLDFFLSTEPQVHHIQLSVNPESDFPFELIPDRKDYKWRKGKYPVYFYFYQDYVIWGITARIINHFVQVLRESDFLTVK